MNLEEELIEKTDKLLKQGVDVLHSAGRYSVDDADKILFNKWRINSLSFIKSISISKESHYLKIFEAQTNEEYHDNVRAGIGILEGIKNDIESGYLKKVESLVVADVFSDFLDMAEHLIANKYKDPAASLTGAVLEDGLRKIALNAGIKVTSKDDIPSLNQKISESQIYNKLKYSQIQSNKKIRDAADHGKFSEYNADDVKNFHVFVKQFLNEYL